MQFTSFSVLENKEKKVEECQAQETRRSCNDSSPLQQLQSNKRKRRCNRFLSTTTKFHAVALLMAAILPYQSVMANEVELAETTPTNPNIDFNTTMPFFTTTATKTSPHLAHIETNHHFTTEKETHTSIAHINSTNLPNLPISTLNQNKDEDNEILTVLDNDGIVKEVKQSPDFVDSKFDFLKISALTENLEETIRNSVKSQIALEQNIGAAALLLIKDIPEGEVREKLAKEILALEEAPPKAEKLIGETTGKPKLPSTTQANIISDAYEPLDNKHSVHFFQQENQRSLDAHSKANLNSIEKFNKGDEEEIQSIEGDNPSIDSPSSLSSLSETSSTVTLQDDEEDDDDNELPEEKIYNADADIIDDENLNNGNDIPLADFLDLQSAEISYPVPNIENELSESEDKLLKVDVQKEEDTKSEEPKNFTTEILKSEFLVQLTREIERTTKISEPENAKTDTSEVENRETIVDSSKVSSEIETPAITTLITEDHNSILKTETLENATSETKAETEFSKTNSTRRVTNQSKSWSHGSLDNSELPFTFGNGGTLSVVFKENLSPEIRPMKCLNYTDEPTTTYTPIEELETTQIPPVAEQEVEMSHVVIKKQGVNLNETIADDGVSPEFSTETTTIAAIIETTVAIAEEEDVEGDYSDEEVVDCALNYNDCGIDVKTNVVSTQKSEIALKNEDVQVNSEIQMTSEIATTNGVLTPTCQNIEKANKEDEKVNSTNQIPTEKSVTNEVSTPKSENVKLTIKEDVKANTAAHIPSETTTELKSTEYITTTNVPKDTEDMHGISVSLIGGNIGTAATKGSRSIIGHSIPFSNHDEIAAEHLELLAPHVSGQTFNDNLGAESAGGIGKALPTTDVKNTEINRSTLIIAICSCAAILFLVISVIIFLLSFHRQHGTLDIEMQEQRCGKDNLDDDYDEDEQSGTCSKLLEVELPTMSTIIIGDETEECL